MKFIKRLLSALSVRLKMLKTVPWFIFSIALMFAFPLWWHVYEHRRDRSSAFVLSNMHTWTETGWGMSQGVLDANADFNETYLRNEYLKGRVSFEHRIFKSFVTREKSGEPKETMLIVTGTVRNHKDSPLKIEGIEIWGRYRDVVTMELEVPSSSFRASELAPGKERIISREIFWIPTSLVEPDLTPFDTIHVWMSIAQ